MLFSFKPICILRFPPTRILRIWLRSHELTGTSSLSFVLYDYSITSSLIGSFEKRLMTGTGFELLLFTPSPLLLLLPRNKHCPQDTF